MKKNRNLYMNAYCFYWGDKCGYGYAWGDDGRKYYIHANNVIGGDPGSKKPCVIMGCIESEKPGKYPSAIFCNFEL